MIIRRLVALAATAAGLLAGTGTGAASAVTSPGPFLDACSVLRAETSNDRLVNGAYELSVGSGIVSLRQSIPMSGSRGRDSFSTTTWFRDDPSGATQALPHDRSSLALYCNGNNDVVARTAPAPQGPWGPEQLLVASSDFPGGIYAPYLHPWSTGKEIYYNLSLWSDYNVMLMKTTLP
jgi:hypothetical protein